MAAWFTAPSGRDAYHGDMAEDLNDKIAVVTGGSSGIGRAMVRGLAARGAMVYVLSRAQGAGPGVVEALRRETGNPRLHHLSADLSSLRGVRDGAEAVRAQTGRIDILMNNAGAFFARRVETADGYEATFALNHLAYFLLSHLLLEPLLEADAARIVNTASEAQRTGRIRFDDPMFARGYGGWAAYSQSKLANVLFTREMARRLEGSGVSVTAFHPGFVDSGFGSGSTVMNYLVRWAAALFARSPERGADTGLFLAVSPEVAGVSGGYFADRAPIDGHVRRGGEQVERRLWEVSARLTQLTGEETAPLERITARRQAA